jgi:hypothetical protein
MPEEAKRGNSGIAILILNLGTTWGWLIKATSLYPWEKVAVLITEEAMWLPGLVGMNMEKRKHLTPNRVRTPDRPSRRSRYTDPFFVILVQCHPYTTFKFTTSIISVIGMAHPTNRIRDMEYGCRKI